MRCSSASFTPTADGVAPGAGSPADLFDLNKDYVQSLLELRQAEVEIGGMLAVDGLSTPDSPTSQGHIEAVAQPR